MTVSSVEERKKSVHVRGVGKDAKFQEVSEGWWVNFNDWKTAAHVGRDRPNIKAGDTVKMTMEVVK